MMSAFPFWRMVTFCRARARRGQSSSGGADVSICCGRVANGDNGEAGRELEPRGRKGGRQTHHLVAQALKLHNVGREHDARHARPVEDDAGVLLCSILASAMPARCARHPAHLHEKQPVGIDDDANLALLGELECCTRTVEHVRCPPEAGADNEDVLGGRAGASAIDGQGWGRFRAALYRESGALTSRSRIPFISLRVSSMLRAGSRMPCTMRSVARGFRGIAPSQHEEEDGQQEARAPQEPHAPGE